MPSLDDLTWQTAKKKTANISHYFWYKTVAYLGIPNMALLWHCMVYIYRNICHGSDAVESAKREIDLWFKPEEVITYSLCEEPMVYE